MKKVFRNKSETPHVGGGQKISFNMTHLKKDISLLHFLLYPV